MVSSVLITGESTLSKLALGNCEEKQFSSKVKQFKRWLMNEKIEMESYYFPYIKQLLEVLSQSGELVFSIDGSVVGKGCMCLMFSVLYKDKAIPVVWQVYQSSKGHLPEEAHKSLLADLATLLPQNCRVVVVGDGEFDGCDLQADILELGWDYVIKTGKNKKITSANEDTFKLGSLLSHQGQEIYLQDIGFTDKKFKTNLFIWHGKTHQKPLYLLTNLDFGLEIKRFYKKRFKIEPFFRDQKSKGFHIHKSGLRCPMRLKRLLIATCLAYVLAIMAGVKACKSILYQQISRTDGTFLSLFQIGYRFIQLLVDLRQWRVFDWKIDFLPDKVFYPDDNPLKQICVPF